MQRQVLVDEAQWSALVSVSRAAEDIRKAIGSEGFERATANRHLRGSGGLHFISNARVCKLGAALAELDAACGKTVR